jgi:ribosome modulation factor
VRAVVLEDSSERPRSKEETMPYKDPEKRQAYQKEYARMRRAGGGQTPGQTLLPLPFRLRTARDVLPLIEEQLNAIRDESEADTLAKARAVGYLAGITLRAVEVADLSTRVEALERVLKRRKAG